MRRASNKKLRYIIMNAVVVILGLLLIIQLFNLQIMNGKEYRKASQSRLFREAAVKAPRGEILDRNGVILATNREAFNVEMLKLSQDPIEVNRIVFSLIQIFEENQDQYIDNFPMTIYPIALDHSVVGNPGDTKYKVFLKKFKIKDINLTDEEIFNEIKKYYGISDSYSNADARKIIGIRYELTQQPLSQFDSVVIAMDVSKETIVKLEERHLDFPGVSVVSEPIRDYPNGTLAAHILGYIGKINQRELKKVKKGEYDSKDMIGKDGLENSIEGLLRGEDGNKKVEVDTSGRLTGEVGMVASEPGNNVYLTIDIKLQEAAEKALEDTITKIRNGSYPDRFADTKAGSVVAVDIKTGQILALANYPSYDPSVFVKGVSAENWQALMTDDQKPMFNRAVAGTYSPGSTFKMVTAMAALGEGKVTTGETIRDLGEYRRYKYAGKPPACWLWNSRHSTHGLVNVSEALKVSCNYFFYEMGYRTGIGAINKYAQTFGLGSKTGIELPGEKAGILAGPDYRKTVNLRWYDGDTLSASIGQSDYSFTPVQMANYIATLVNGGTKNKLTLINKVTTWDGSQVSAETVESVLQEKLGEEYNTKPINTTFNQSYVSAIFEGMKSVTGDAGGTAYGTFVNYPVKVAGKTGTAQIRGRYKDGTKKSDNAWFVGFAPYENPQIAVVVIIEHGGHGAYTAPVAKEIFSQYFGIKKPEPPKKEAAKTTQVPPKKKDIQSAQKKNKKDLTVQTEKIDSDVQINQNAPADSTNQDGQTDQNTLQNNFINQD